MSSIPNHILSECFIDEVYTGKLDEITELDDESELIDRVPSDPQLLRSVKTYTAVRYELQDDYHAIVAYYVALCMMKCHLDNVDLIGPAITVLNDIKSSPDKFIYTENVPETHEKINFNLIVDIIERDFSYYYSNLQLRNKYGYIHLYFRLKDFKLPDGTLRSHFQDFYRKDQEQDDY
jgi:hypothetical protein